MKFIFGGLRGKLILTYTLVTVLAMMALEAMVLMLFLGFSVLNKTDQRQYLDDVMYVLYPRASEYLQPGREDLTGLQKWLDGTWESGYASQPAMNAFDSPAAAITPGSTLLVLDPKLKVIAQSPATDENLVGRAYPVDDDALRAILNRSLDGEIDSIRLSVKIEHGRTRLAVPIFKEDVKSKVVGVILVTVEPVSPVLLSALAVYLGAIVGTGLFLLVLVAPFGALFGFVASRGLTRRLTRLARAADEWSDGNFVTLQEDRSRDEIGVLSTRMRHMAERIQDLLHAQQELGVMEERNRLARDLHDTVKQQSFATYMQIRAARNLLANNPAEAEKHLQDAEGLIRTSQQELNLLITELRPAELETQGLQGALQAYAASWYQHTRIPVNFTSNSERRLPLAVEQALFRVTQEALSNVARHSRATAVNILLDFTVTHVRLEVDDNGIGFDPQQVAGRGFGLESMQERVRELGGKLEIKSQTDEGTRVVVSLPILKKG